MQKKTDRLSDKGDFRHLSGTGAEYCGYFDIAHLSCERAVVVHPYNPGGPFGY